MRELGQLRAVSRQKAGRLAGRRKLPARWLTWPPEGPSMDGARSASSNGRTPGSFLYVAGTPELNNVRSDLRSGEVPSSRLHNKRKINVDTKKSPLKIMAAECE